MYYFHQLIIISITTKSISLKIGSTSIPSVVKLSIILIYSPNSRILYLKTSFIAIIYLSMLSSVYLIKSIPRSSHISYQPSSKCPVPSLVYSMSCQSLAIHLTASLKTRLMSGQIFRWRYTSHPMRPVLYPLAPNSSLEIPRISSSVISASLIALTFQYQSTENRYTNYYSRWPSVISINTQSMRGYLKPRFSTNYHLCYWR